jgi:hypothetical protein
MPWEVRMDGSVYAHGPIETLPDKKTRGELRAAKFKIYVDGRLYRE